MKKVIKSLVVITLLSIATINWANGQNPIWSLPPSYYVYGEGDLPLPIPPDAYPGDDYTGQSAAYTHNAMPGPNGNPLFFIVDGRIYDAEGYFIDRLVRSDGAAIEGSSDVCIVPDPGNCQRFYIFISASSSGQFPFGYYTILDLSLPSLVFPPEMELKGAPIMLDTSYLKNSLPLSSLGWSNHQNGGPGDGTYFDTHFAATKRLADNSHWLFVVTYNRISKFKIDDSGVSYVPDIIHLGNILTDLPFGTGTLSEWFEVEVFEMTSGHFKVALSLGARPNNSRVVVIVELDENGEYVENSVITHHLAVPQGTSTAPVIKGMEFSKNGTYLYFTHHITTSNPNPIQYINTQNGTVSTLSVPNAANYQYSQIELATDDRLYFAHAGGLATLLDSENPASSWNATAIPFAYPVSDVGYPGQNNTLVYLLPDQIDGMDYSQFFNSKECCRVLPKYDHEVYQATQSGTWEPGFGNNPLINSASDVVRINQELRIPSGIHITIKDMRFEFFEDARCIIEPGASLTLDGTTFTVGPCDALMWHGIEVWGNPSLSQYPISNQGFLVMKNNSVVEHARIGAIMAKKTFNMFGGAGFSTSHYGGVINSINSTFRNNIKDVVIANYINPSIPNRCRFTNTHFLTDGLLNHPDVFPKYHAELENVKGVLFTNCSFLNTATFGEHIITNRGTGINSSYATFKVVGNNQPFDGDLEAPHQSFYQLYRGIFSFGNESHPFTASKMEFQMNQLGIGVIGSCFETIIYNKFTVPENIGNYNDFPIGCFLIGSYMFTLEENDFNSEENDWSVNYGLIVANSSKTTPFLSNGPEATYNGSQVENEVYRNDFNYLKYGLTVLGDNRGNSDNAGLQARCNIFVLCETDIFIADHDDFAFPAWRDDQGAISDETLLTNNVFSYITHSCLGNTKDIRVSPNHGIQLPIPATSITFQYFCLNDVTTKPDVNPACEQLEMELVENQFGNTLLDYANHCPSNFPANGGVGPKKLALAQARSNLETAIELYEITIDGGEKEDILQALAAAHSYESQFLRNMLLERYPLSHEVLMAALARASSFDPWHLTQVLVANAKLSNDIMTFLEDNNVLSPFFMQFIYDANASGSNSLKAILESEISYRSYDKSRLERKINRHYLDVDSLDATGWNDFIAGQTEDYYLMYRIGDNLQLGNITKAVELKDSLTATHPDMLNWLDFRFDVATADSIDSNHINTVWDFYNESQAVFADALGWLYAHGEIDSLPKPPVHVGDPRSLSSQKPKKSVNKLKFLEAWPNPANDRVMLTYPNEADGLGVIQIFNQQGVLVHQVAAQGKGIAEINTSQWSPGIYIALLKVEGKVFDEVKISVVR